jgi:hypothetical protein
MLIATVVLAVPQAAKAAADGSALSAGIVVEGKLAGGQSHSYSLPLTTGQSANLVIEQKGIDCVVRILDPDAHPLANFDSESRPV